MGLLRYIERRMVIAGLTAVTYVGLVCLMALCAPALDASANAGGHEHHDHNATHSSLCSWACQVSSQSEVPVQATFTSYAPVAYEPGESSYPIDSICHSSSLYPRAPPLPQLQRVESALVLE